MLLYRDGKFEEYFENIKNKTYSADWSQKCPACPLPYLSGLYHGTVENATDMIFESYPIKDRGGMVSTPVEAINSLAAIKKVVFP